MQEYYKIAENSAKELAKEYDKLIQAGKTAEEGLVEMFKAFQEINGIRYPYKHVDVSILVSFIKNRTDQQPTLREELALPPMVAPVDLKLHESVHFTPDLVEGLNLTGPAIVISVENYLYVKIAKGIVLGVAIVENEEDYHEYIKRAKKILGAMTKPELDQLYKEKMASDDDASATPDKIPSEESPEVEPEES